MSKEIKFYQLNLHKCEIAQSNLMIELMLSKDENFICLLQEPHFFGLKPSSANKGKTQIFHGIGTKKTWPRAMIIAYNLQDPSNKGRQDKKTRGKRDTKLYGWIGNESQDRLWNTHNKRKESNL